WGDRVKGNVGNRARAESDRVVCRQARLGLDGGDRGPGGILVELPRVQRDRRDAGRPRDQGEPLMEGDELAQRRDREARVAVDDRLARLMAEDERVRRAAVHEPESDARVGGMEKGTLTFDP